MSENNIPVVAIDGPSASGKGTVASLVAKRLGFHYLDSGALYRLVALAASHAQISLADEAALAQVAQGLDVRFGDGDIWLGSERVTEAVRTEACGNGASQVAAFPRVRQALLERQRVFRQAPGLVADGRDMGSVVFPDAATKIFLTASAEARAQRRYKQLIENGLHANIQKILQDIQQRDARDSARSVAPLQKCADASLLDTTPLGIIEVVDAVLNLYQASRSPKAPKA
jgi:cytidylate kinase